MIIICFSMSLRSCLFCDKSTAKCKQNQTSQLTSQASLDSLLLRAARADDSVSARLRQTLSGRDLTRHEYHRKCYKDFCTNHPLPATVSASLATVEGDVDGQSQADFLAKVSTVNGLRVTKTLGGGDCFFDGIRLGCAALGLTTTVQALRALCADS